jgi:hypothetical protein
MTDTEQTAHPPESPTDWREFLEDAPPEISVQVSVAADTTASHGRYNLCSPSIQLRCTEADCDAVMWFDYSNGEGLTYLAVKEWEPLIVIYKCRHCKRGWKAFAIYLKLESASHGTAMKLGEYPSFGSYTPPKVISLIGPDREMFLKGRRAENRGLGIGAYAYYRRVVENQKNRILGEIIKVAKKVGAASNVVHELEAAMKEAQFSKAIDSVKPAIPESLLIDGHNPLKLLHSALSSGLHEQDDAACLELAASIRIVLTDLSERIALTLRDHNELTSAVSKILQTRAGK